MPDCTIETSYRLPAYRHRTYQADTVALACRQAIEDDDWYADEGERFLRAEVYEPIREAMRR